MFQKKPSASEVDGVQYRRAKTWQIICYACNAFVGMSVYSLIGMASYSASIGYGITTATVGLILMLARILDGFTDPMLAFVYDRVNTRFGKLRVLLISGYLIEAVGLLCMFNLCSSKGLGLPVFALTYIIYIIGYTVTNMTAQTLPAIMTNDPRQRPTIGVWTTALNYAVPMGMSMLIYTVILPKCGGTFNQDFLSMVCTIVLIIAGIGTLIVCAGISAYDKPESFEGTNKKHEPLKIADVLEVLKHNKPLQCYIASNASDKLAQQVGSQAIINTMLNGILIGNMGLATTLGVISMVPSIFFAAFGAKYVGKKGSKKGIVTWTCISMAITAVLILFFIFTDTRQIGVMGSWNMIVYVLLTLQCYIASNASDKLAQQVGSQAIINTMLNGILIGNMGLATTLGVISMVPSIFFAAFGAKYVGKKGSKKGIVTWTCISMAITAVLILFFIFTDTRQIGVMGSWNMIVYVLLTLLQNGSNMCITTSNTSYMADTIDYELDRSGRYIPAVVSGTYSLIDKLITSVAAVVATGAVAILGYTTTMPQPTDAYTSGIFWMTLAIKYGLPMLGWLITLLAMVGCPLTKEEMVNVQKRIADKKEALRHEVIAENMQ